MLNSQLLIKSGLPAIAVVAGLAWSQETSAGPFDCSFDTDTCGFVQIQDDPDPSTSLVQGGQLIMHTMGQIYAAEPPAPPVEPMAHETYGHAVLELPYTNSWSTDLWVKVPTVLDPPYPLGTVGGDFLRASVGLAVLFSGSDGSFASMSSALGITSDRTVRDRRHGGAHQFTDAGGSTHFVGGGFVDTTDEEGFIGIRFDSSTKILTAYNQYQDIFWIDIDSPTNDWNMANSDIFQVAIFLEAREIAVPDVTPLEADDFKVNQVPLPAPLAMLAGASVMFLFAGQRRTRRQKALKN